MSTPSVGDATKFPTGEAIQALPLIVANHVFKTVGAASVNAAVTDAKVIRVAVENACFIQWGASVAITAVATTDIYFPAGVETLVVPAGMTHIAFIQQTTGGVATITQLGKD